MYCSSGAPIDRPRAVPAAAGRDASVKSKKSKRRRGQKGGTLLKSNIIIDTNMEIFPFLASCRQVLFSWLPPPAIAILKSFDAFCLGESSISVVTMMYMNCRPGCHLYRKLTLESFKPWQHQSSSFLTYSEVGHFRSLYGYSSILDYNRSAVESCSEDCFSHGAKALHLTRRRRWPSRNLQIQQNWISFGWKRTLSIVWPRKFWKNYHS